MGWWLCPSTPKPLMSCTPLPELGNCTVAVNKVHVYILLLTLKIVVLLESQTQITMTLLLVIVHEECTVVHSCLRCMWTVDHHHQRQVRLCVFTYLLVYYKTRTRFVKHVWFVQKLPLTHLHLNISHNCMIIVLMWSTKMEVSWRATHYNLHHTRRCLLVSAICKNISCYLCVCQTIMSMWLIWNELMKLWWPIALLMALPRCRVCVWWPR